MSILSENLKKARKAIPGLNQDNAAKLIGIKRTRLCAWEDGRSSPPINKFPKIVEAYNITDWIGFISNEAFDPKKQSPSTLARVSIIEKKYEALPKNLKNVAKALLNCGKFI